MSTLIIITSLPPNNNKVNTETFQFKCNFNANCACWAHWWLNEFWAQCAGEACLDSLDTSLPFICMCAHFWLVFKWVNFFMTFRWSSNIFLWNWCLHSFVAQNEWMHTRNESAIEVFWYDKYNFYFRSIVVNDKKYSKSNLYKLILTKLVKCIFYLWTYDEI